MKDYSSILSKLDAEGNLRSLRNSQNHGKYIVNDGKRYVNLSSNDYLGISDRQELQKQFLEEISGEESFLFGSTSSRLLTGSDTAAVELEHRLEELFGRESALVFDSGYHANTGILPALADKNDLILADKLVHASIIDGLRLSEAHWERFRHNDLAHLQKLLEKNAGSYQRIFIVTESVFSMDGDVADLKALCDLKDQYGAMLYVDEAHAFGVIGQHGLGLSESTGTKNRIDLLVGTFGKAIASQGAYLVANKEITDYLVNTMRTLIFTTALPPISSRWTRFVIEKMLLQTVERNNLRALSYLLRDKLAEAQIATCGSTHIVPIVAGENERAIQLSQMLMDKGFFALPIRYPTVPKGEARIRISLNPNITEEEILQIVEIAKQWKQNG